MYKIKMRSTRILFQRTVEQMRKIKPCLECVYLNTETKTCGKYSQQDIVMDRLCHPPAQTCRENEAQCGIEAKGFQQMTAQELRCRHFYDHQSIPLLFMANTVVWTFLMCNIYFR